MNCSAWRSPPLRASSIAILLAVAHPAHAQDGASLQPDDGVFPLMPGQVVEFQQLLQRFHYDPGPTDGTVGSKTVSAANALAAQLEREIVRRPSGHEIVLSCEIEEGVPKGSESIQIMVDESRGIVVYNFHLPSIREFNPIRKIGNNYIDLSMKITLHNDAVIQASDTNGVFAITKSDGKFVYSFVSPFPLNNGEWLAFGNTHRGKCARSAFD